MKGPGAKRQADARSAFRWSPRPKKQSKANATATSTYYAIEKLTEDANNHIQSYGVLDAEKGVYHMPIDAAIEKIATQD